MVNPSRIKGTRFESELVAYLNQAGAPYAERRALHGNLDKGDITGLPGVVLEAKACKTIALAAWCDELRTEIGNAKAATGAVIAKRRGKNIADAYAVLPLDIYCALLRDAGYMGGTR